MLKKVVFLSIVIAFSICFSVFAFSENEEKPKPALTFTNDANSINSVPDKKLFLSKEEKINLYEMAKIYDINTSNLTDDQILEKVTAAENLRIINKANQYGIVTNGLTVEQVKDKVLEEDKKMTHKMAKKRTEEEKKVLDEVVNKYEIDVTGLTDVQIKEKAHEKLMIELIVKAKELGIAYDGLNYDLLLTKIKAKEIDNALNNIKK